MPSILTRSVFRSLVANEPLAWKGCLRLTRTFRRPPRGLLQPHLLQRRRLFGLADLGEKKLRAEFTHSKGRTLITSKIIGDLIAAQRQDFRPPPRAEVAAVMRKFLDSLSERTPLTEYDINLATISLRYIESPSDDGSRKGNLEFSEEELYNLLEATISGAMRSSTSNSEARELGDLVVQDLLSDRASDDTPLDKAAILQSRYAEPYINLLISTGSGEEALGLVRDLPRDDGSEKLWLYLLRAAIRKQHDAQAKDFLTELISSGARLSTENIGTLIRRAASFDLRETVKYMYSHANELNVELDYKLKLKILNFCMRNKEITWGRSIYDSLDPKEGTGYQRITWLWKAANGEPAERIIADIESKLSAKLPTSETGVSLTTINGLVSLANSFEDVIAAAKYLDLMSKWGFKPDAKTHLVRVEHYLQRSDVSKAVEAVKNLGELSSIEDELDQSVEALQDSNEVFPKLPEEPELVNQLLTAACMADQPDYDLSMVLLDRLVERTTNLDSSTVAALTRLFLVRAEYQEVHDLLEAHHPILSKEDRQKSRDVVVDYIKDPKTEPLQAWHAYDLLHHVFADTSREIRKDIMNTFFDRKRPDLASLVFGHMRQQQDPRRRPTADLYTECFKGIARSGDPKALELVHNMLKLDIHVDPNTRLLTSLMLAWASAGEAWRSLQIFDDILNGTEGPTYTTLEVLFRCCEMFLPNGQGPAMRYMARIKYLGFEITPALYRAYVGVIACHGDYEACLSLVKNMEAEIGHPLDAET